jgi:hypothetical protein
VAETRAKKSVAAVAKKAVAPKAAPAAAAKAKTVRAVAQKIETETVFSNPIEGITEMTDTVKKVAAEAGEKATAMLKDVNVRAKDLLAKGGEMTKEAKGAQTAAQNAVELTKKNWEANTTHAKALTGVRAPADFFKMQTEFARTQFDAAVAEMSKNTEFTLKLAGEVVAPLQNRYSVVVEQVKARMAA